jgi:lysyl-tRNA synthetase class 2
VDAVVVATVIGGLIVLGLAPFDLPNGRASVGTLIVTVGIDVLLAALAAVKGKPLLAVIGIFFPPASLAGAVRLASPRSPWARRRYGSDSGKQERSRARWARIEAWRRRISDTVAGAPAAEAPGGAGQEAQGAESGAPRIPAE